MNFNRCQEHGFFNTFWKDQSQLLTNNYLNTMLSVKYFPAFQALLRRSDMCVKVRCTGGQYRSIPTYQGAFVFDPVQASKLKKS